MTTAANAGGGQTTFPWWLVLLEGIFAIIFGILLFTAPSATLLFLARVLGLFLLTAGMLRIVSIFSNPSSWGWKLVAGIIGVLAGIVVLEHPLFSVVLAPVVVFVVGILSVIQGGFSLIFGLRGGGWGVVILGILSLLFGIVVLFHPLIGSVLLPFVLGIFMLIGGVVAVVAAFRLRSSPAPSEI